MPDRLALALRVALSFGVRLRGPSARCAFGFAILSLAGPAVAQPARYLVRLAPTEAVARGAASLDAKVQPLGARLRPAFRTDPRHAARHRAYGLDRWFVAEGADADELRATLAAAPGVDAVLPDVPPALAGTPAPAARTAARPSTDDPLFPQQWALDNTGQDGGTPDADIDAPEAWALHTGSPAVVVAVVDGGVDFAHPDLAPAAWTNPGETPANGRDDDGNGYVDDVHGWDFVHDDADPTDDTGHHGTAVAGLIAAARSNGEGVAGVAGGSGAGDGVRLMATKAYEGGASPSVAVIAAAFVYAADNGAVIANASFGGPGPYPMIEDAVRYFVAAAGGEGAPLRGGFVAAAVPTGCAVCYPAAYPGVAAVTALDRNDVHTTASGAGPWVDLAAPGDALLTTLHTARAPGAPYGPFSGGSAAAPVGAGVAALVAGHTPGLTAAALLDLLARTADPVDAANPSEAGRLGAGRVNAAAALATADAAAAAFTFRLGADRWHFLAAPVGGLALGDVLGPVWTQGFPGADATPDDPAASNVFAYVPSASTAEGWHVPAGPSLPLRIGRGYLAYVYRDDDFSTPGVQGDSVKALPVSGPAHAGPFAFDVADSGAPETWNLLGNPFEVGMDWDAPGWVKEGVSGAIYVWDPAAGQYLAWNGYAGSLGSGVVPPGAAFWVVAASDGSAAAPRLVAPAAARADTTGAHPATAVTALALRLAGTVGGRAHHADAAVTFGTEADGAWALAPLGPDHLVLAAVGADGGRRAIDVRSADGPHEIPLDVRAVAHDGGDATLTLSWPALDVPDGWRLNLRDRATGAATDLRRAPGYTFTLPVAPPTSPLAAPRPTPARLTGTATPRFVLTVEPDGVTAVEGAASERLALTVGPNPARGAARVRYTLPAAGPVRIAVYDALGRTVAVPAEAQAAAGPHEATLDAGALAAGAYVVRMETASGVLVRRLTVVR